MAAEQSGRLLPPDWRSIDTSKGAQWKEAWGGGGEAQGGRDHFRRL